jgi:hypothetical protein
LHSILNKEIVQVILLSFIISKVNRLIRLSSNTSCYTTKNNNKTIIGIPQVCMGQASRPPEDPLETLETLDGELSAGAVQTPEPTEEYLPG